MLDIEILEVNRERLKRYGINLSSYTLGLLFSPELAPPNTGGVSPPPPFNLNTISQGVSTADFYLGVPSAVVNFLANDSRSKTLAKPQLRGQEGQALTLNLGSEVPILETTFGQAAAGGFATIPQSSYSYKPVGVNLAITVTRVTYEGDIILDLSVENNAVGAPVDVGGQSALSFTSRKVHTFLRLREGEANLLAGLIKQDNTTGTTGFPGLSKVPGLRWLFSNNEVRDTDTDIVDAHHAAHRARPRPHERGPRLDLHRDAGQRRPHRTAAAHRAAARGAAGRRAGDADRCGRHAPAGVPGPPVGSPAGVPPTNPPAPAGTQPILVAPATAPVPGAAAPAAAANARRAMSRPVRLRRPERPPRGRRLRKSSSRRLPRCRSPERPTRSRSRSTTRHACRSSR